MDHMGQQHNFYRLLTGMITMEMCCAMGIITCNWITAFMNVNTTSTAILYQLYVSSGLSLDKKSLLCKNSVVTKLDAHEEQQWNRGTGQR
jgi:hypothetical protein